MPTIHTFLNSKKLGLILLFPLMISTLYTQTKVKESTDSPLERYNWELMRSVSPETQTLPANIRTRELEFSRTVPAAPPHNRQLSKRNGITSSDISMQFAPIGPYNVGGRTRAFAQDITKPNVMLAGGVSGGVWRSVNSGATWTKTLPANEFQNVSCIVQDKRAGKTNIWYMGTGEVLSTTDRRTSTNLRTILTGTGIYKSIDGGVTWTVLPSTQVENEKPNALSTSFQGVWDIAVNPANSTDDEVYAACYGGIMRSTDGGENWMRILGDSAKPCFNSTIVVTPSGIMYSALSATEFGTKPNRYGVFRSTDGKNWTDISPKSFPDALRRFRLSYAPSNESVLYVLAVKPRSYANVYTDIYNEQYTFWKYQYLQDDGSGANGTWENRQSFFSMKQEFENSNDKTFAALSGYCLGLAVKPNDENAVLIAGSNLYYSTNGFADTSQVNYIGGYPYIIDPPVFMHPDVHNIIFDVQNPNKLYSANDGGIDMMTDINNATTSSWTSLNNGYTCTQFYGIALDHKAPSDKKVVGGLQDNSSFITNTSVQNEPWGQLTGGDGCVPVLRHEDNIAITTAQGGFIIATILETGEQVYFEPDNAVRSSSKLFVTNIMLDPWEENTLFYPAGNRVFSVPNLHLLADNSVSDKITWVNLAQIEAVIPKSNFITAMAASAEGSKELYLGTHLGKLYSAGIEGVTGNAVKDISSSVFPANSFISSIAVDTKDSKIILVAFSNYSVQSLFATTDGGKSWTAVAGNLEMNADGSGWGPSFRCVKILRRGNNVAYAVGTSTGLYTTLALDGAKTEWTQQGITTIGNLAVETMDFRESDGWLVVGTHGGGAFASTVTVGVESQPEVSAFSLEQNYPNPVTNTTTIYFSLDKESDTKLTLMDVTGKTVTNLVEAILPAGQHHVSLPDELCKNLSSGMYYYHLAAGDKKITKMMTVVK